MLSKSFQAVESASAEQALEVVAEILGLARWAPSGDNTQPWRFSILGPRHVVVHGFDTREQCVYDMDGRPSQLALGCLVETAAIAATAYGLRTQVGLRPNGAAGQVTIDLQFEPDADVRQSPLIDVIKQRSVQRRPYATTPLPEEAMVELEAAVGPHYRVTWLEGAAARRSAALLMFRSARLRLVTPEAYQVHRDVIEWNARYSADKVPDQALGVPEAMLGAMRVAMQSWRRVQFLNRFMAGTWAPRILMDLRPALACAAHFALLADRPIGSVEQELLAGRAVQRFWLTATRLGLMLQPELTPLIFARYAARDRSFSVRRTALQEARRIAAELDRVFGPETVAQGVFMGRIGYAPAPTSRSTRRELSELLTG